ncbi:hypothetical protein DNTS_029354 [Danionella cerebrum]|uniref:Dual serine/threonine and tyrosine protein kinase n=1 Tax=Danionella cerebrum TaxID=2873325 RepID=A0A553Q7V7_9TELE|nr:hypothetical protein DNTS_029354 [Danionella translucida]TRY86015.1 hypothetical protein DNTS_029354 [Danionella translucida]
METPQRAGALARELSRAFGHFNKHSALLKKNLKETGAFFREIRHNQCNSTGGEAGESWSLSFSRQDEEFLQNAVNSAPFILIVGQSCSARYQLLNFLLGERLLPLGAEAGGACGAEGGACRRRKLCFTHGRQKRLSLALPGQYELVHQLAAHCGCWDTVPREDLEIQECEDPAQRLAELDITLHHTLLQEVKLMVLPCRNVQPLEEALESCRRGVLPIILYAINQEMLTAEQINDLQIIHETLTYPVCFVRIPAEGASPVEPKDRERSALFKQLLSQGLISGNCACGAPAQSSGKPQSVLGEGLERLHRVLVPFVRQVLQFQQVEAATHLNSIHCHCLDLIINQAFDMQRDLQITPLRLDYTRQKESELFHSLMSIANRKQEEMRDMILSSLSAMRETLLEEAQNLPLTEIILSSSGEPVSSRDIKLCIDQIQELIVSRLNQAVASKLTSSVDYLRESFTGTLERCLSSLEKHSPEASAQSLTSDHLKQILNAAYHVEVTFHSGSSVTRLFWEQIKQIIHRISWVAPPSITAEWKRKVAQDAIESLSANKLAKSICSQFRSRLNSSHEAFSASLRQVSVRHRERASELEEGHTGRLERTEDQWVRVRKDHAPRLARLSLESRSLNDILLHGKPRLGRELGRGQYGVVYLCESWAGKHPCALKSVVPPDDKHWNDLALEFHYTRSLSKHERLVNLHGSVIDHSYGGGSSIAVLLIMERLHRDLYAGLKMGLSLRERLQIALDVVEGIRFLHSQGLLHRDIKLKNVLLDKQNRAKITDLGFWKYDNSVDVYAFGILFWYLCSGSVRLPEAFEKCSSKDQLWTNVKKGSRPERLPVFDEECWQLMECCWSGEPSQRPLLGIVQPRLQSIMGRLCDAPPSP